MTEQGIVGLVRPLRFRGKERLLNLLTPRSGARRARIFGATFDLDVADWIQRSIYFGTFEPDDTRLVARFLRRGMTVVDVGANVGYYTALAAWRVGATGRVFAVEPGPREFERLQRLIVANSLPARAFNFGLDSVEGTQGLYETSIASNHTMIAHGGSAPFATIRVRRLDDLIEEWGVERIDLLKIDVEGWEARVFAGARRALASGRVAAILCEFNDGWLKAIGSSARALWEMLKECGYRASEGMDAEALVSSGQANCNLLLLRTPAAEDRDSSRAADRCAGMTERQDGGT